MIVFRFFPDMLPGAGWSIIMTPHPFSGQRSCVVRSDSRRYRRSRLRVQALPTFFRTLMAKLGRSAG